MLITTLGTLTSELDTGCLLLSFFVLADLNLVAQTSFGDDGAEAALGVRLNLPAAQRFSWVKWP